MTAYYMLDSMGQAVLLLGSHDSSEEPQKFHGSNSALEIYGSGSIFKPQNKALGCLGWLKYNEGLSHKFIAYDSLNHRDLGGFGDSKV